MERSENIKKGKWLNRSLEEDRSRIRVKGQFGETAEVEGLGTCSARLLPLNHSNSKHTAQHGNITHI